MGCGPSTEQVPPYSNHDMRPYPRSLTGDTGGVPRPTSSREADVDEATLNEYMDLESQIQECERGSPLSQLEIKAHQWQALANDVARLEEEMGAGGQDPEGTKEALMEVQGKDMGDREMQEYMANINKQEMAKNELETKKQQVAQLEAEVKELNDRADKLQGLYKKQDDILARIFNGEYGSEEENVLEGDLEDLELEREKILEANFKWRQSQMLMEFACKQLAIAVTKWQSIPQLPEDALEQRYAVASEARNNLTAAAQNIQGAHRYLDNITFPYCTPDEVETLQRATMYVYTDMQNLERHEHAEKCYVTTHKRAAALLQWFDQVLTTSILKDLADVNEKVKDKTLALRRERVRLIKDKMEKTWGRSVDISLDADSVAFGASMDAEMAALEARLNAGEVVRVDSAMPDDEWRKQVMSPGELAPVPTREELFGRIDELTKQHREEAEALKREQEQIQQRVNAELQEKLNARRQRRARRSVEEKEKAAYA